MTLSRRAFGGLVTGAVAAGSGCLGFILGNEAQEFEASPATVGDSALDESGYEQANEQETEKMEVTRTFEAGGQERDVVAVNYISEYEKNVSFLGQEKRAAVFVAFSTPKVEVLGETFNPVGEMSNKELIQQIQGKYEGLRVGDEVDTQNVQVLDDTVEVSKFEGRAEFQGSEVDVYVHVGQAEHDGDFVIPIAVYPQVADEESETIANIEGIEH